MWQTFFVAAEWTRFIPQQQYEMSQYQWLLIYLCTRLIHLRTTYNRHIVFFFIYVWSHEKVFVAFQLSALLVNSWVYHKSRFLSLGIFCHLILSGCFFAGITFCQRQLCTQRFFSLFFWERFRNNLNNAVEEMLRNMTSPVRFDSVCRGLVVARRVDHRERGRGWIVGWPAKAGRRGGGVKSAGCACVAKGGLEM